MYFNTLQYKYFFLYFFIPLYTILFYAELSVLSTYTP
jgi:hypothetical protein